MRGFFLGDPLDDDTSSRLREIFGLSLIGLCVWLLVAMVSFYAPYGDPGARGANWGGQAGFYLANGLFLFLGLAAYLAVLLALAWSCILVAGRRISLVSLRCIGGICFVFAAAFLLQHTFGPELDLRGRPVEGSVSARMPFGPGGWLALQLVPVLVVKFGGPGLWLLLLVLSGVSFLLATERAFYPAWQALAAWAREQREKRGEGFFTALRGWTKAFFVGLWNFVRGADIAPLGAGPVAGAGTSVKVATPARSSKAASKKSAAATTAEKKKPAAKAAAEEDEDELADDDEDESDEFDEDYDLDEDDEDEDYDAEDEDELDEADGDEDDEDADDAEEDDEGIDSERELTPAVAAVKKPVVKPTEKRLAFDPPTPPPGPWTFPPVDLLLPPESNAGFDDKFLEDSAAKLENALRSFRVEASVVSAQVGPAVTLFELTVVQGTRMNKVTQLSQEIAAALRAQSVRIIAPIPGRETIGIEVPNAKRRVVRISELITQKAYDPKFMALPLFIGMDAEGTPIVEDLARMPHLLIAGTTGSGKSVCINTILCSLLLTRSPHDVKMILIDPKMVELQTFSNVPHQMCPVVTDARQATGVLLWAVEKMEGRYELFKNAGVKNIKSYNALGEDELKKRLGDEWNDERTPRHVPYIVVVVDEMADLMMTSKKEAELAITRLAQKSRAVGIHVIVATQRPSTDVITGVIKGNLPTRIAFQVASKVDSRVILDHSGAEKLLGGGDMLYTPPQSSQIKRVQGALVEDSEIQKLVDFVCTNSAPNFSQELIQVANGERQPTGGMVDEGGEDDELFDQAVMVILKSKRGSASLLQRALGVGYTRASRLIDIMTERGIVGPHKGSKSREILMTLEQWEEMHGTPTGQGANDE
ncbi:MAG: DNA translocase FtsK 4TM domain-containing protein [Planctomycetota bacterium]